MSFQSLAFLAFLAVTTPACLLVGRRSVRTGMTVLGAASVVFYVAGGGWDAFSVLCAGTLVSVLAVQNLRREESASRRRRILMLAAGYHIAVLLVFKYAGFFTGGRVSIGWVPLGLSFFTFQQLWLLKEVYTGQFCLRGGGTVRHLLRHGEKGAAGGPFRRHRQQRLGAAGGPDGPRGLDGDFGLYPPAIF